MNPIPSYLSRKPYWLGYDAQFEYEAGEGGRPECPFPEDSEDAKEWEYGRRRAEEDSYPP